MKILITGSTGFLGNIIKSSLEKNELFQLNRTIGDYKCTLEKQIPVFAQNFDIVIHSAGKAHSVPKAETEKQVFYDVNVTGTQNLLKGLDKSGLPRQFVFISSVSVYGLDSGKLIKEDAPLLAKDPYGLSKIAAEQLVLDWCTQNKVVCTILRLPLLVGKNPPGNLGSMLKALERGYYFNIGGGNARKSMVLAQDVARFIPLVAPFGGVYNLTDGVHPSFYELSEVIATLKNKKLPLNMPLLLAKSLGFIGDFLGNEAPINSLKIKKITSDLTFDDAKARELLHWNPHNVLDYLKKNII